MKAFSYIALIIPGIIIITFIAVIFSTTSGYILQKVLPNVILGLGIAGVLCGLAGIVLNHSSALGISIAGLVLSLLITFALLYFLVAAGSSPR